jgi:hypothetical protein
VPDPGSLVPSYLTSFPSPPRAALPLSPARLDSLIVSQVPPLFAELGGKRVTLLWRGSGDGFGVRDFHERCDGRANTLTFTERTAGNIFGGLTPVEWDSSDRWTPDPSLKGFLFTLKNPQNFPEKKFALKAAMKDRAIYCSSAEGVHVWELLCAALWAVPLPCLAVLT